MNAARRSPLGVDLSNEPGLHVFDAVNALEAGERELFTADADQARVEQAGLARATD